jgi:hypothetical protein
VFPGVGAVGREAWFVQSGGEQKKMKEAKERSEGKKRRKEAKERSEGKKRRKEAKERSEEKRSKGKEGKEIEGRNESKQQLVRTA